MFLTKDLHIHWREGEKYFMQKLVDGDIPANNGGWQWSAGTGADAVPYFRILNPWRQTKSYDPQGDYIKACVPELRHLDPAHFTKPPVGNWPPIIRSRSSITQRSAKSHSNAFTLPPASKLPEFS
jgi:deoxyribodipyrimidine photo-lyase